MRLRLRRASSRMTMVMITMMIPVVLAAEAGGRGLRRLCLLKGGWIQIMLGRLCKDLKEEVDEKEEEAEAEVEPLEEGDQRLAAEEHQ
jgi:hypothetical protein